MNLRFRVTLTNLMEREIINPETLQDEIHKILRFWHRQAVLDNPLMDNLRLFQHLVSHYDQSTLQPVDAVKQLVNNALTVLAERHRAAADLLKQRFIEGVGVRVVTQQLAVSESQFYNLQNEALSELTKVVLDQERQAQFDYKLAIEARLESLAHQRLFGVDGLLEELQGVVGAIVSPWLISIEGMGGIGKTSLADRLVRRLISNHQFIDMAWISARQENFLPATGIRQLNTDSDNPALTSETLIDMLLGQLATPSHTIALSTLEKTAALNRLLKKYPYLIVVDNLETVSDYQALIPLLRQMAGPSKFLLTSRHSLRGYADIHCIGVTELSQTDTITFLTHESQTRGLTALARASPEQLNNIYQIVGGNPLAIKLVLGQIHALPLSQVLENLKQAQGRKTAELYTYIFWQSWQNLSDTSRQALLALPVAAPRGSTLDHLQIVSGLEAQELSQALEELIEFSLVDVGGDLETRRYSIHRLTETFLLTEVTQWPPVS